MGGISSAGNWVRFARLPPGNADLRIGTKAGIGFVCTTTLVPRASSRQQGRELASFCASGVRRLPGPSEIGFVLRISSLGGRFGPGQASRGGHPAAGLSSIRNPQSKNWVRFAQQTPPPAVPQIPQGTQVWLRFARLPLTGGSVKAFGLGDGLVRLSAEIGFVLHNRYRVGMDGGMIEQWNNRVSRPPGIGFVLHDYSPRRGPPNAELCVWEPRHGGPSAASGHNQRP